MGGEYDLIEKGGESFGEECSPPQPIPLLRLWSIFLLNEDRSNGVVNSV